MNPATEIVKALANLPPEVVQLIAKLVEGIAGHEDPMRAAEEAARSVALDTALSRALPGPK